jgi:hypothetical protein
MSDGDAREALTSAISTLALLIKPHRQFNRQYGPSWITNPNIDFRAGTIAMPLVPVPGTWDDIIPRLTHVPVNINLDQFDSFGRRRLPQLRPRSAGGLSNTPGSKARPMRIS